MQWQARTVAAAIDHMTSRYVLGASPFEIERLVQAMYRNEYARGGPVLNSAIAAIEFALWDICGKALGQPAHNLLGGRVHADIPAYANGWHPAGGGTGGDVAAAARSGRRRRLRRAQVRSLLGARPRPGPRRNAARARRGRSGARGRRSRRPGLRRWPRTLQRRHRQPDRARPRRGRCRLVRGAGRSGELRRPRAGGAPARLADRLRRALLFPLPGAAPHRGGPAARAAAGPDPGRRPARGEEDRGARRQLLSDRSSFHAPFGPVATAAILQLYAATTNVVLQESFSAFDAPWRRELVRNCPMPVAGRYPVSLLPGLGGIELDDAVVRDHPYQERALQSMWAMNGPLRGERNAGRPGQPRGRQGTRTGAGTGIPSA